MQQEDLVKPQAGTGESTPGPASVEAPTASPQGETFGSDVLLDTLRELGCRYLPTNPGSTFRGLHDSIVNRGGNRHPQLLLCHHEEIAVAMAHGYAKATGGTAFALVHDLVGLMHASMAVYDAWVDQVPLVLLGGGGPMDRTRRRPIDWVHSASAQAELVRPYVKWDAEPVELAGTRQAMLQAAAIAATAPQGPVYVTLDAGVQEQALAEEPPAATTPPNPAGGPGLNAATAERIARMLASADAPAIVVGPIGYRPATTNAVSELAQILVAACFDVDHAAVVPTDLELNLTGERAALADADVILALGVRDLASTLLPVPGRRLGTLEGQSAGEATVVDIGLRDLSLRGWSDAGGPPLRCAERVLAEPVAAAETLAQAVGRIVGEEDAATSAARRDRRGALARRHRAVHERALATVDRRRDESPVAPIVLVSALWEAVRDLDWLLVLRNTRTWPEGVWKFRDAGDYIGNSGGAGVGYGPGAAVGGALGALEQGRLGVGIVGDGDLLMAPGAIWTAVHYRIPLLLVVNDNGGYHNDEDHQVVVAKDRGRSADNAWIGVRLSDPNPDIAQLCRAYGAWSTGPVTRSDELAPALAEARREALSGRVAVVHVRTAQR